VRDTSNVEMTYNAGKYVRILNPSVTDDRFKKFNINLLYLKILVFMYQSV